MALVHFDYCHFRGAEEGQRATVLVGRDESTGYLLARVVPAKGGAPTGWTPQRVANDLAMLGHHGRVVLRSDQEVALVALLREVAECRPHAATVLEQSPSGDSRANGAAERAVRAVEEICRTHKVCLESRAGVAVDVGSPLMAWLVANATDSVNKLAVRQDGRTAYRRVKGRDFSGRFARFAEPVMYKISCKPSGGLMEAKWAEGIWLGLRFASGEHIIARRADGRIFDADMYGPQAGRPTLQTWPA